jgi:hypothetical protein
MRRTIAVKPFEGLITASTVSSRLLSHYARQVLEERGVMSPDDLERQSRTRFMIRLGVLPDRAEFRMAFTSMANTLLYRKSTQGTVVRLRTGPRKPFMWRRMDRAMSKSLGA